MRININFFITISLLLISFTGFSQMGKRYDDWQHPVLKRLERHDPNLATFSHKDSGDYLIPLAILNKANGMLYYISTFGQVFDSMSLSPFLSKELVGKRADAFRLYTTLVTYTFLKELEGIRSQIRAGKLDVNKLLLKKTYLNYKGLKNAISSFEQLTWLINQEKLVWKNHYLFNLDLNRRYDNDYIAKEQDFKYFDPCKIKVHGQQYMDSVEYTPCNRYTRLSGAVLKPDKRTIYLFDQQNRMFDSFSVKADKMPDISADKHDVFALYQLWLEWQLEKLIKEWNKIIPQKPARFDESLLGEEKLRRLDTLSRAAWVVGQKMRYATIPDKDLVLVSIAEDSKTTPRKKWIRAEKRWSDFILEADPSAGITTTFRRGQKEYFLTDHRGNVVATVSDRKIQVDSNHDGKVDYYVADVITATDYAPFGAHLTGRTYRNKGQQLKYGYNGKENDNEVKGEGNQLDYGFRIYDPRLGRFLSVDPLTKSYPWYTPYQFAGNKPIVCIDLDGAEEYHYLRFKDKDGKTVLALIDEEDIIETKVTEKRLGRGGNLPTKTGTVKNAYKLYTVHQESEYEYSQGAYVYDYDEEQSYKTLTEANAVTDESFEFTEEDFFHKIASSVSAYTDGMTDAPSVDWTPSSASPSFGGGKGGRGGRGMRSAPKGIDYHLHHLVSKGLGKTSKFVQKAIEGGFKLNGKMNLTPVERFIKKFQTGVHAKHVKYTNQIKDFLEGLDITKFTPEKANSLLQKLNDHIIQKIKDNPNVKINDLDLDLKNFKVD